MREKIGENVTPSSVKAMRTPPATNIQLAQASNTEDEFHRSFGTSDVPCYAHSTTPVAFYMRRVVRKKSGCLLGEKFRKAVFTLVCAQCPLAAAQSSSSGSSLPRRHDSSYFKPCVDTRLVTGH